MIQRIYFDMLTLSANLMNGNAK